MSLRVTWLSAGTITDDEDTVLRRGESGLFDEQRARSLHRLGLGRICDDDPEIEEVIRSSSDDADADDEAKADTQPEHEVEADGTD